ncbi:hypothetical protein [Spirosoma endbachense]|uniref:Uncharacterized protein n=1 Tax=Spirosoma endbachense TaxID=2666025 RepID=A0A6P1W8W7_9BACT|nr:hypothetical protein [Spirosoma endbachense]QHW00823.1 hypothetical protein GJR95_39915 [Spirosoma endbachense]
MTDHLDYIRFEITRRYIELAESGQVDDKYLERARLIVDVIQQNTKLKKAQATMGDESFGRLIGS